MDHRNRWWVISIFYLSSSINYLDRNILTAVSPAFMAEFGLNLEQYGKVLSAFGTLYLFSPPLMGLMLDRLGLNIGTSIALAFWSIAGIARGFTTGLYGLVTAHGMVAIGEGAGIPSTAKAAQMYLKQEERAIGSGLSQFGLVIGMALAAGIANFCLANWGWRSAFFVAGWLGLLWIPLWFWASKKAPVVPPAPESTGFSVRDILTRPQTWGFYIANVCSLGIFLFCTMWANHYFVRTFKMTPADANRLAPLLQFVALIGSFLGGWASMRLIRAGWVPLDARRRIYLFGALGMMVFALVPQAPNVTAAVALICIGYLASSAASVNLYTMPLDAYGGSSAAFAVSLLTSGYGLLQMFVSPAIGRVADQQGFAPICVAVAFPPLFGYLMLHLTRPKQVAA